jgi:hypothetical protein
MNTNFNKSILATQIICLLFLILSCSTKNVERVNVIEHAFNISNIDSTLALCYTDDITFVVDNYIANGKHALRGAAEWDSVINTHLSFSDFKFVGDTIICKCSEENDLSKLEGLDKGFYNPVTFIFKHGKISYAKFERTLENSQADSIASSPFMQWISEEKSEQFDGLMTDGKFVLNAVSAKGMLSLAQEWRESIKH